MKWISVEDRLPEDSGEVIVAVTGLFADGARYQTWVSGAWFDEGEWWYHDNAYVTLPDFEFDPRKSYTVTHWMLYPELPQLYDESIKVDEFGSKLAIAIRKKMHKDNE